MLEICAKSPLKDSIQHVVHNYPAHVLDHCVGDLGVHFGHDWTHNAVSKSIRGKETPETLHHV